MEEIYNFDKLEKNHSWDFSSIILVEPSKPQNLGNIARVMMNFGFSNLIIIEPQLNLADPEVEIVARRANTIINRSRLISSLREVRESFDLLIGTTSRIGSDYNLKRVAISPEQLLEEELKCNRLGVIFGREQHGLTNEEIAICDLIVSIPTHGSYPAMNISHAVTIILYFLSQKFHNIRDPHEKPRHRAASYEERQQLLNYFKKLIETAEYHLEKQHVALQAFSNVISRGYVTGRELTTLMGVLKWVELNLQK